MATYIYNYSLSEDFPKGLRVDQLEQEIKDQGNIINTIVNIRKRGDIVNIDFTSPLSTNEENHLNVLIANHVPIPIEKRKNISLTEVRTRNSDYTFMTSFIFKGSASFGELGRIRILSRRDIESPSYCVKIYDYTHNKLIGEANNLTNTSDNYQDIDQLSNIPSGESIFEVHMKVNCGMGYVYVRGIQFINYTDIS